MPAHTLNALLLLLLLHHHLLLPLLLLPAAYTSLALFNLLRLPLAFLPMMVTMLINALVALNRIRDFLTKSESGLDALRRAAENTAPGHVKVWDGMLVRGTIALRQGCWYKDVACSVCVAWWCARDV